MARRYSIYNVIGGFSVSDLFSVGHYTSDKADNDAHESKHNGRRRRCHDRGTAASESRMTKLTEQSLRVASSGCYKANRAFHG